MSSRQSRIRSWHVVEEAAGRRARRSSGSSAASVVAGVADERHLGRHAGCRPGPGRPRSAPPAPCPARGRCLVYGKFVPTMSSVSHLSISSSRRPRCRAARCPPVVNGRVVRDARLAGQRLHDRARRARSATASSSARAPQRAGAGQDRDLARRRSSTSAAAAQVLVARAAGRAGSTPARSPAVAPAPRAATGSASASATCRSLGKVMWRHRAAGQRVPDREVDQRRDLRRVGDHHVVLGDVLEQLLQVHLLLVAGAEQRRLLHAGDRQHRRVVELGVVQPVEQVDAARARTSRGTRRAGRWPSRSRWP